MKQLSWSNVAGLIIRRFFRSLTNMFIFWFAFGIPITNPKGDEPKCPYCGNIARHRGGYCSKQHKELHRLTTKGK